MRWLVTGGAGYIGAHVLRALLASGEDAVVIDDLSTGNRTRVPSTIPFYHGDILDGDALLDVMTGVDGVIHLAGRKSVSESVDKPLAYYDANLMGTLSVLRAMQYRKVKRIIFSSTASLYATSDIPVTETSSLDPQSPYAASKMFAERCIKDYAIRNDARYVALRYFNVVGAANPSLADTSNDNLVPKVLRSLRSRISPEIYGNDYPTKDGTCVRDYVHVVDIADAHALVAKNMDSLLHDCYNIGTGHGVSVKEMVKALIDTFAPNIEPLYAPRRDGDPASVVANVKRISKELGFTPKHGLIDIASSV